MDYAIKTLSQLRPILQGFRKAAGLTQTAMAAHLGVTQQTYAQLEANPAAVSVERLFRVLRILQVDLKLTQSGSTQSVAMEAAPPAPHRSPSRRAGSAAPAAGAPVATKGNAKRATRAQAPAQRAAATSPGEANDRAAAQVSATGAKPAKSAGTAQKPKALTPAKATKTASASKKREDW
ncbi:helix-turn-helix transcriptional regulator [Paraburkholderia atlantica]|uniref:Transcriptional regulator, XRE family n=1 Tax=Paraburkholderia atlantica TaxID=2654982 RepID=D5WLP9_PARAM|nr:helix-turn-helix transcriptional regulator [Paraburkholderia atlantica]ADG20145.1 transcriptional regulator, XRE family [Paraburkholderia atlantica]MBB5508850.1 HTH-type transcriptional regulator/antitoxin HipB [Paraburkholderia atlantica]